MGNPEKPISPTLKNRPLHKFELFVIKTILCFNFRVTTTRMKHILPILTVILCCFQTSAQFTRVEVNTDNITHRTITKNAGDNDLVSEIDGELYHITYSDTDGFVVQWIENSIIDIYDIEMHDIDQDGDLDIMCYQRNAGGFHVYLKENGLYVYAPEETFNWSSPHFLHAQDFNDDGIEDLMMNHGVYVTTGINERTRVFRYPVGNTYYYDLAHFMDHDQDGDKDILFHQVNRLWVLDNLGTDFSASAIQIPETNNRTSWCRVMQTNAGERYFFHDNIVNKIRELSFDNGTYILRDVMDLDMNGSKEAMVSDLDGDGNMEIIINRYNNREVHIFKYDTETETGSMTTIDLGLGLARALGVFEIDDQKMLYVGNAETHRVYRFDSALVAELHSSALTAITGRHNGFKDFDGDGNVDIISGNKVKQYLGDGRFGDIIEFNYPSTGGTLEDYDNDGDADYVKEFEWFENVGNFMFGPSIEIPDTDPTPDPDIFFTAELIRADIDKDGDIDILTYNYFGEPLQLLENINNTHFEDPVTLANSTHIGGDLVLIDILDIDGDADNDIVMAAHSGMIMMKGHGDLTFDAPVHLYDGSNTPLSGEIADFNSDGFPDILLGTRNIIAGASLGEAILYVGNADVPEARIITAGKGYHRAGFGNFDNADWLDIMFQNGDGIFWTKIQPDLTFSAQLVAQSFLLNGVVLVSDVNADGDDDLILYDDNELDIYYYLNDDPLMGASGCPQSHVFVRNSTQADRYRKKYGTCPTINGDLFVGRGDGDWSVVNDLSAFSSVTHVSGDLNLNMNDLLDDLHGLDSLEHIGGSLIVNGYKSNSLAGIEKLRYIGGDFHFVNVGDGNTGSIDMSEFASLDTIRGHLSIDRSDITSIGPIIQDTFYGNVYLSYIDDFFTTELFDSIRSIKGRLTVENTNIESLEALGNLRELGGLRIYGNQHLQKLGVANSVEYVPGQIYISYNPSLTLDSGLDSVRTVGGDVYINDNVCRIMKNVRSIGGKLTLISRVVDEASFTNLESLGAGLSMLTNEAEDFHQFSNLKTIGSGRLNITNNDATSFFGLHNITGTLDELAIDNNSFLRDIQDLNDSILVDGTWRMAGNDVLNYCNVIPLCNHLARGGETDIRNNGIDCSAISSVRCLDNAFSGFVFYDFNQNGVREANEALLPNVQIVIGTDTFLTAADGYYVVYVHEGDSITVEMLTPSDWVPSTDALIELDSFIVGAPSNYGNDFGLVPLFDKRDFSLSYNQSLFLCSREYMLDLTIFNQGTFEESGELVINYPEHATLGDGFDQYLEHDPINNILRIAIDTIYPFFSKELTIPFVAPGGEHLDEEFVTRIALYRGQSELVESHEYLTTLRCSYDPNDKLVRSSNGGVDIHRDSEDALIYTVRFQNTGNYFAENVRIVDTLSASLDLHTLVFLAASHSVEIRISGRVLYFNFYDINLPDSTMSFVESQGYVTFRIRPEPGLSLGEEIDNDADIYFDYNEAILTNLVKSSIVDITFVADPAFNGSIKIFPNPASDRANIALDDLAINRELQYQVIDVTGSVIRSGRTSASSIDLAGLAPGMYFLHLADSDLRYGIHKIVKSGR